MQVEKKLRAFNEKIQKRGFQVDFRCTQAPVIFQWVLKQIWRVKLGKDSDLSYLFSTAI